MPFCPFCFRVPLLQLSIRKKGTLIGLLRNLVEVDSLGNLRPLGPLGLGLSGEP